MYRTNVLPSLPWKRWNTSRSCIALPCTAPSSCQMRKKGLPGPDPVSQWMHPSTVYPLRDHAVHSPPGWSCASRIFVSYPFMRA